MRMTCEALYWYTVARNSKNYLQVPGFLHKLLVKCDLIFTKHNHSYDVLCLY